MQPSRKSEGCSNDEFDGFLLTGNAIRLLRIQPSSGFHDPICCSMKLFQSGLCVNYTALSYSWGMNKDGDDSLSREIWIDGEMSLVTQNLFEGLKRVREAHGNERPWLWVDALCINQADPIERTAQVANMAVIFANASRVIAWLGDGDSFEEDQALLRIMQCLSEGPAGFHDTAAHSWSSASGEAFYLCRVVSGEPWKMGKLWLSAAIEAVDRLSLWLNRRYFSRRWIVQEIFHPDAERVFFRWGSAVLPKRSVSKLISPEGLDAIFNLHHDVDYGSGLLDSELLDHFPGAIVSLGFAKRQAWGVNAKEQLSTASLSLPAALSSCWHLECKEPRDKLYALLSLDRTYHIPPDYEASEATVWKRFALALVNKGELEFLLSNLDPAGTHLPLTAEPLEVPSWVPDLRVGWQPYHRGSLLPKESIEDLSATVEESDILKLSPYFLGIVVQEFQLEKGYFTLTQSASFHGDVDDLKHAADFDSNIPEGRQTSEERSTSEGKKPRSELATDSRSSMHGSRK